MFLYPALTNANEPDPRKRSMILAFSGARQSAPTEPTVIAMEATALFTTALLGITDKVFAAFSTVLVPHTTLLWLWEEKRQIAFHQPSQVAAAIELRRLINENQLGTSESVAPADDALIAEVGMELASLLAEAERPLPEDPRQRVVVRPGPVHRIGSLMEEEADLVAHQQHICSCANVVAKLRERGVLTLTEEQTARAYLSLHEKTWPHSPMIQDGAVLYLDDLAISYLQHLNLLPKLHAAGLTACVSGRTIANSDALIAYDKHTTTVATLIEELRIQLRDGLAAGKVRAGTLPPLDEKDANPRGIPLNAHPSLAILDLAPVADAVVSDDRFINQHPHAGSPGAHTPILSTLDLLNVLHARKVIGAAELTEYRTLLRRKGMQLVSIMSQELADQLGEAAIVNGRVAETAELKAIRESVLQLRMSDVLQLPKEAPWLDNLLRVCSQILRAQWHEGANEEAAAARSSWLIELWDIRSWSHRLSGPLEDVPEAEYRRRTLMLVMLAGTVPIPIRAAYWKWLETQILKRLQVEEPEVYGWIVAQIRAFIDRTVKERESGEGQQ